MSKTSLSLLFLDTRYDEKAVRIEAAYYDSSMVISIEESLVRLSIADEEELFAALNRRKNKRDSFRGET